MTERSDARFATIQAYWSIVVGPTLIGRSRTEYTGTFRCQDVASAVEVPKTSDLSDHREKWQRLYRVFDEEWSLHERDTRG